jgi:hypothetical protein
VFVMVTAPPTVRLQDVRALEAPMRALVAGLDPDDVFVFEAPAMFEAFDVLVRLGESAKTLLARRVEAAATWKRAGYRSAAEQMAAVAGTSVAAARTKLETSKQVAALPSTAEAMRAGTLSTAKAEAIASAATVAPEAEARLLAGADAPLAVVRDECLKAKAKDRDAAHARIRRARFAREHIDGEGAWNFHARGTVDDAARFRNAFDPIVEETFEAARAEGRKETRDVYAFDALMELGDRARGTKGDTATPPKSPAPRFMGLVRVDHAALVRGAVEGDEVCEIAGLGPIPVATAREVLGDAILKVVITKGVDVANVTSLRRSPTMAQRVALWWQAPTCTNEDCTHSRRLENDHEIGWAQTKRTRVDELDPLCTHDHMLKTRHGWALVEGTGKRAFVPPDDPRHPKYRPPDDP